MHLPTSSRTIASGLLAFAALSSTLRADTLTWDSSGLNPNAPVDGTGAWDTSSALWSNGTVDSVWNNAGNNTATFGSNNGAAGTITVGTITAGGLIFNAATSGSYLLSGGTLTSAAAPDHHDQRECRNSLRHRGHRRAYQGWLRRAHPERDQYLYGRSQNQRRYR